MSLPQPLAGLKVVEFTHMVMGPAAGAILAALGAEVVRIEPVEGDKTRTLLGSGAGYFPMYNRHKKSVSLDLKSTDGLAAAKALVAEADILIENFRPDALEKLGLGYKALSALNPRLIYCSAKGFLPGPYEKRTALDEVAQMMGGLAYMTGPPGRPLRAGSSVIDVTGGMFGVIGVQAACDRQGAARPGIAVRDHRISRRPAHGAARRDRQSGKPDAGANIGLGHLRRLRDQGRSHLHRRGYRCALGKILRSLWPRGSMGDPGSAAHQ